MRSKLTQREQSIYDLLLQGHSIGTISDILHLGLPTVNQTLARTITKLLHSMPNVSWQHCVALCASSYSEPTTASPIESYSNKVELENEALDSFLRSKDTELSELETLCRSMSLRVKTKVATV